MRPELIMQITVLAILIIQFIVIVFLLSKNKQGSQEHVLNKLIEYDNRLDKNESNIRNELELKFGQNRSDLTGLYTQFSSLVDTKFNNFSDSFNVTSKTNRDELSSTLRQFEEKSSERISILTKETREGLEKSRDAVEKKLNEIQEGNEKNLKK